MSRHFVPVSEPDHEKANQGHDVSDICANCQLDFKEHTNGACPRLYDRMKTKAAEHDSLILASYDRACKDQYAVLRVSAHRWRIIQHVSHSAIGWGTTDTIQWWFASEPLTFEQVGPELRRLRQK